MKRIAVVGFGFMGVTHTMNILKNPSLELVAIVDVNPENIRKNMGEQLGNFSTGHIDNNVLNKVRIYESLEKCLINEKLDACVISVHTNLHFELSKMAIESGVNVFLEKPFCLEISECEELVKLADQKNILLMIGHVVRFMPPYLKLKNWFDTGEFGSLKFLSLSRFSGVPVWGQWREKQKEFGSSGGALFDLVIHDIDFAQWLLGVPENINSKTLPGRLSNYDYVNANWKYENGTNVKIEGGNIFHTSFPFQASYIACFEKASLMYKSSDPESIIITTDTETKFVPAGDAMEGFSEELAYFAQCLDNGEKPDLCTPESARQTIEICYKHI